MAFLIGRPLVLAGCFFMFVQRPLDLSRVEKALDPDTFSSVVYKCPKCGKTLNGILEIVYHGNQSFENMEQMFASDIHVNKVPFLVTCSMLHSVAMFVRLMGLCKESER